MTIEQNLIDAGYKKHVSSVYYTLHMTDILYQKCIRDERGKRYYINYFYYPENRIHGHVLPEGCMFNVQFKIPGSDHVADVHLSFDDVSMAENEYEEIWYKMGYGYKELWEE